MEDNDEVIMALEHKTRPIYGVQFHPESIDTDNGKKLIENFESTMKEVLEKINNQVNLSMDEMQDAMNEIMSGKVNDIDMESFLIGLNIKGISEEEITAAAMIMREKSLQIDIGDGSHIDTCGTGGTGLHTFNCSTASSFVAAAGGAKITKHGNKAISSKSGSADFLVEAVQILIMIGIA